MSRGTHLIGAYLFSIIKVFLTLFSFVSVYALPGLILIFLGGLIYSIPLWIYHLLQSRIGWDKSLFVLPFLWTAYITHISDGLLALPILSFSLSQAALPWLIQYIDITGNTAIIFWLVLLNVLLTKSIHSWNQHRKTVKSTSYESVYLAKRVSLIVLCMFLPPLLYAVYTVQVLPQHFTGQIQVGLVQPGFTADETSGEDFGTELFYSQIALSDSMTTRYEVDLVVWSESAMPFVLLESPDAVRAVFGSVLRWGTPMLTGTFDRAFYASDEEIPNLQRYLGRNYALYNSAMMITPQLAWMHLRENLPLSSVRMYHKTHLMPFTEYVPLSDRFPRFSYASVFNDEFSHFSKGNALEYLSFAARNQVVHRVSPIICWDLLSARSSRLAVGTGAQFIAALTNESALGDRFRVTVHQMESYSRFRSIESRRSIAKAALTGYSLFTNPFG